MTDSCEGPVLSNNATLTDDELFELTVILAALRQFLIDKQLLGVRSVTSIDVSIDDSTDTYCVVGYNKDNEEIASLVI